MNGKVLPIALAISLTINVFIIGAVVGAVGTRARFAPMRPPPAGAGMGGNPILRAADDLPEDVRNAYRQRLREQAEASRPLIQEARGARQQAADAFAADKFDKAAALAALSKARADESAAREKLETAVVDFAADLPQDQRRQLSRALRQPGRPGLGGRRGGGPGGPAGPGGQFDGPPPGEPR